MSSSKNNWTLCKSLHFKLVFLALATDELTSKAAEVLYTQDFRSSSRQARFAKKKKNLTKAEVFLLVLVLAGYSQLRNCEQGTPSTLSHSYHFNACQIHRGWDIHEVSSFLTFLLSKGSTLKWMGVQHLIYVQILSLTTDTPVSWRELTELILGVTPAWNQCNRRESGLCI